MLTAVTFSGILKFPLETLSMERCSKMNKTVILGAAGAIGKAIGAELARRGESVRVVGRHTSRLQAAFTGGDVEIAAADLETPEGAAAAVAGADTAVMAIGMPYPEFHRYPPMMRNVVSAAEKAGVRRFLLVTNIYPYGRPLAEFVDETHPLKPSAFKGRMRLEQEQILQKTTRMRWMVLRLPDFFGPDAELSYARMIFEAALNGKAAQLFSPAGTPHQFVYTADAGPVVADLLAKETGWNEVYHFAGSGLITVDALARQIYSAAGETYRRQLVQYWLLRIIGVFKPVMREFCEMNYLQSTPVNLSDAKLVSHLGSVRRTPYADGIAVTLESMGKKPFAPLPS